MGEDGANDHKMKILNRENRFGVKEPAMALAKLYMQMDAEMEAEKRLSQQSLWCSPRSLRSMFNKKPKETPKGDVSDSSESEDEELKRKVCKRCGKCIEKQEASGATDEDSSSSSESDDEEMCEKDDAPQAGSSDQFLSNRREHTKTRKSGDRSNYNTYVAAVNVEDKIDMSVGYAGDSHYVVEKVVGAKLSTENPCSVRYMIKWDKWPSKYNNWENSDCFADAQLKFSYWEMNLNEANSLNANNNATLDANSLNAEVDNGFGGVDSL